MRTLIETTLPTLAIIALPMMFYIGIIFGNDISQTSETSTSNSTEMVFEFADEPYIDDIPFNTERIAEKIKFNQSFNAKFNLAEEETIEDIPINTIKIMNALSESLIVNK